MEILYALIFLIGVTCILIGAWIIHYAYGLVVSGVFMIFFSTTLIRILEKEKKDKKENTKNG
jgi:prepilin signal peptidase PulO-like enzyme (type II secretory pathway)